MDAEFLFINKLYAQRMSLLKKVESNQMLAYAQKYRIPP